MSVATVKSIAKPKMSLVSVTPKDAQRWLEQNGKNRSIRGRVVDAYARDMESGDWQVTGDAIKFAFDGTLLDGQHRLCAVVLSGATVEMFVVRGLAHDSQEVMDNGSKRTASDALALRGEKNTALLAATARLALTITNGGYAAVAHNSSMVTTTEITNFIGEHPELTEYTKIGQATARQIDCSGTVVCYAMWRLFAIDAEDAADFFEKARERVDIKAGDPVLAMTRRFAEARRHRETLNMQQSLGIIFRAWNARRTGKSLNRIPVASRNGDVTVPEPV